MVSLVSFSYVALLSGLELGDKSDNLLAVQLMVDLLTGQLGDEDQQAASSRILQVIIAGNSLSRDTQDKDAIHKVSGTAPVKNKHMNIQTHCG